MKKLFKKSIACLIAVLMVVSTMPFTALTAQAATAAELQQSIDDTGFNGYTADCTAAADGSYSSTGLLTTDPIAKKDGYYIISDKMSNVLYTAGVGNGAKTVEDTFGVTAWREAKMGVRFGDIVFLYDGTNDMATPINAYHRRTYGRLDTNPQYVASNTANISLKGMWHGSKQTSTTYQSGTSDSFGYVTADQTNYGAQQTSKPEYQLSNTLYLDNSAFSNGATYVSTTVNFNLQWRNGNNRHNSSVTTSATVNAVNYTPIKNILSTVKTDYETVKANVASNPNYYTEASLTNYYQLVYNVVSLDPNSYNYASDAAGQAKQAGDDIAKAADAYTKSGLSVLVRQYGVTFVKKDKTSTTKYYAANTAANAVTKPANTALTKKDGTLHYTYSWPTVLAVTADATYEEVENTANHTYTDSVTTDPTCITPGVTTHTCACGHSYTTNEPAASGHTEGEAVRENENPATCTTDGSYDLVVRCTVCDVELSRETKTIDKLGHDYKSVVTAPTCTEQGYTTYTCSKCGDSYVSDYKDALGHDMQVVEGSAKAATCTEAGKEADKACSRCDYKETGAEIPANGHTRGNAVEENRVNATCTVNGSYDSVVYCTVCNDELSRETITLTATGHDYTSVVTAPTCTEQGYTTYTCNQGDHTYVSDYKDALGHDMQVVEGSAVAPTCTVAGKEVDKACSRCDYKETGAEIPANGHTEVIDKAVEATCTTTGLTEGKHCSVCNEVLVAQTETPALGHDMQVVEGSAVAPTCTVAGKEADKACSRCDYKETGAEIPANGHTEVIDKAVEATCTTTGLTEGKHCSVCNEVLVAQTETPALGHDYVYAKLDADNHKVTCSRCDYSENKPHSFDENNTCKDCEYKKVTIDRSAYDDAVAEYQAIKTGDYTAKYTEASREAYQTAVEKAIINDFTSQPVINAATSAILEAKTMLCLANVEIKVYVAKEGETRREITELSTTKEYGTKVTIDVTGKLAANQMISKWTIETKESSVTTKLSTVESAIEIVATEPTDVYVHVVEPESTETAPAVYSKVSFISKNGAVSSVEYVKNGETLNTDKIEGVKIPFYKFIGWSKASVTGTGEDIEVKAIYEFIEAEVNMCTVHYNGTSTKYAYDKFVYIYGAENDKLALSTTNDESGIITYLNENAFYAPHVDEIYVIEVDTQKTSIGITGTYFLPANEKGKKTFAFNCKMFLPEDCELVEAGAILKTATATKKAKAEKISARGEYTIKVTSSTAEYVEGKAYLTYKDKNGNLCTIYTDAQTITES